MNYLDGSSPDQLWPALDVATLKCAVAELEAVYGRQEAIAGFLVSPDIWDVLVVIVPVTRGNSLSYASGLHVTRSNLLPPGTVVPLDARGKPLLKPTGVDR